MLDEKTFAKKVGRHLAAVRASKGYSQDRLCLEAGFSRATVHKVENGKVSTSLYTVARIAEILEVPLKKLVDFE